MATNRAGFLAGKPALLFPAGGCYVSAAGHRTRHQSMEERLNKILSTAGIASRREADELIRAGRVTVNGEVVTNLGTRVDPARDTVRLDGERILSKQKPYYVILYKPLNCMTTLHDEEGRFCVGDLIRKLDVRLYPAGRLDWDSEGLLILTNDGEFANHIMHPRYAVPKIYLAKVEGKPGPRALTRLRKGVRLEDGPTLPARVEVERAGRQHDWLRITLTEGRNRIVRRMCERVGHSVIKLKRIGVGPLRLGDLKPGEWRTFTPAEMSFVADLKAGRPISTMPGGVKKKPASRKGFAKARKRPIKPGYKKKQRATGTSSRPQRNKKRGRR